MTVGELIQELLRMPKDKQVCFAYDYGDYNHTEVAPEVDEVVVDTVKWSDYHETYKVSDDGDVEVVVLKKL